MKRLFSTLICATLLAACSGSGDANGKAVAAADQNIAKQAASAGLNPASIAGYDEKLDIEKIGLALRKSGMDQGQQKEREWKQRLSVAKSDADVKAVLNEQLKMYSQAAQALSSLEMKTEKGKTVHNLLSNGFSGMTGLLETLKAVDMTSAEGNVVMNEAMPKIRQYASDIAQGMQLWIDMMKNNNYKIDSAAEAKFQEKMKEAQKLLDEK